MVELGEAVINTFPVTANISGAAFTAWVVDYASLRRCRAIAAPLADAPLADAPTGVAGAEHPPKRARRPKAKRARRSR